MPLKPHVPSADAAQTRPRRVLQLATAFCVVLVGIAPGSYAPALQAQPSVSLTIGSAFDSYRPVTGTAEARRTLIGGLSAEHGFAEGRGRLSYALDAGNYDSPGDWSYRLHDFGASFRFAETDTNARQLFLVGSVTTRRNGTAWTSADYSSAGVGVNVALFPRSGVTARAGYRADFRRFGDLAALTQLEQRGFASLLTNFQTRTTLIVEGEIGAKRYDGLAYETVASGAIDETTTAVRGRGYGAGMGPSVRYAATSVTSARSARGTAGMASAMARVAQSLTDRTGVRLQATARRTFGTVAPLLVTTPAGFFEDGVYDDPFASDALLGEAGIRHDRASGAGLSATLWLAAKHYTSAVAPDSTVASTDASARRWDHVATGNVTWSQPLFASSSGALALSGNIGYRVVRHRSLDAYYNYTAHAVHVGFTIDY